MKKIGVNALVLNSESGGLGTYLNKLIEYLDSNTFDFDPIVFLAEDTYESNNQYKKKKKFKKVKIKSYKPISRIIREPFIWKRVLR